MTIGNRANILVVDDTVENLHLLSTMLQEHGYEVRPVTSGRQALLAAKSFPPDVILLDVSMPGMDGYEVCRALKAIDGVREVPVIFLTALGETADKVRAFSAGGMDYVTKPFHIEEVLARVKAQVDLQRSRRELVESYQRLQGLERLREDLVQMLVHDMRSPLMALAMILDLVREQAASVLGAEAMQDLQTAVEAAARVNSMANDLLDVSRMEEGKLPLDRTPTDLTQICREVVQALAPLDRTRRIEVTGGASVQLTCDRAIVRRVVENLTSNAVKHTPEGGRIGLDVSVDDRRARLEVRDEGSGVPPEARTKIFERFGAVQARQDSSFHSAGLGLAFCKLAVQAHGGAIGVDDAEPHGSVFWFEVPLSP